MATWHRPYPSDQCRRATQRKNRRGVTIVVVLAVISISLALSYAMLRSQGAALAIQQNSHRLNDARAAAMSGITDAIGTMHRGDWQGVDIPLARSLGAAGSYDVTFQAGDPRLKPGDADYADLPYRVTAIATGYGIGDTDGGISTHRIQAVLRLQPQRLNTAPQVWPRMLAYSVYQWSENDFVMQTPARIEGPVYINGKLSLCADYPSYSDARERYLRDLDRIRDLGRRDDRPFTGPIDWRSVQSGTTAWHITQLMDVAAQSFATGNVNDFGTPSKTDEYQLYPGGPRYEIPELGPVLEDSTLAGDPQTNPLGLFYRPGALELRNNVQVNGTLLVNGDVRITGRNVRLSASEFRGVGQPAVATRFPALVSLDDVRLTSNCEVRVEGVVVAGDRFVVDEGADSTVVSVTGRLIAGRVEIYGRRPWFELGLTWLAVYDLFRLQLLLDSVTGIQYFPDFLATLGLSSKPNILVKPGASTVVDHWQSVDGPVYQPATTGEGLKWDVIDWTDQASVTAP